MDDHTLRLIRNMSSSVGRIEVASPASVCSRQTNPGVPSASALIGRELGDEPRERLGFERRQQAADVELGQVPSRIGHLVTSNLHELVFGCRVVAARRS
jgi:hypothetical protein